MRRRGLFGRFEWFGRVVAVVGLLAGLAACSGPQTCGGDRAPACLRVLFVGNSYTFVNDLPGTFAWLARAGGHRLQVDSSAWGGATLGDHDASADTARKLAAERWDMVVLQEQSVSPAIPSVRERYMFPPARSLAQKVLDAGARPLFFMTWAHRDGWPEAGIAGYEQMQAGIEEGYLAIGRETGQGVVPVGAAWRTARGADPTVELWGSDGSHPALAGTYLAACVFYAAIYRSSPAGLPSLDGVAEHDSARLQSIAAETVLANPSRWNL